ncbi:MAG: response regulator transcription factor [Chloroflexia bacterium]|nr:response regulator transcription factor [Chloroflexia bacterium]MDQ3412129.1 response regulator transcription factor [Chloroflexota bacterium]
MRILLIEDELAITRMVERGLAAHGHQVLSAENGEDGLLIVASEQLDLVLLDIGLPDLSGHEILREIRRQRSDLPVIMLTARDDVESKVSALDGGADDYITKPFSYEELLARIRARTRDTGQRQSSTLELGDLTIDLQAHRVWRAGDHIDLSRREFALLEYFARNRGRLLSRQQILTAVWEYEFEGESNVVDVYVRYLRNKLDREGEPSLFSTIRGSGYRFDPPPA